jgi:cell division septum initiation protein DivIVA
MELTPELFEKQEFAERRRGYDIDQVETFMEEAGTALAQLLVRVRQTEAQFSEAQGRIAEAEERARRAEAEAQRAIEAAQASQTAAAVRAVADEEAEVEQAAKTLLMAKRTAEATEREARNQAQALLGEAKIRADRQLAEAQAEAEELIRRARSQADEEFADRRQAVLAEVHSFEERRAHLNDALTNLEARLAAYREDLTRTAEELTLLASDPDRLGARPSLSIPPDEVFTPAEPDPQPLEAEGVDVDAVDVDKVVVDASSATSEAQAVDLEAGPPTEAIPVSDGGDDQWGPGSWARLQEHDGGEGTAAAAEEVEISLTEERVEEPTTAEVARDRYLAALDESADEPDEAMTAFFEGGGDERNRRFGWRR